jgi:hypothetical protein
METSLVGATTPYYSAYAGSKTHLEDFNRALAKEIGNHDCRSKDNDVYVGEDDSVIEALELATYSKVNQQCCPMPRYLSPVSHSNNLIE